MSVDTADSTFVYGLMVLQGSELGPLLFNVFTSDLLQFSNNPIDGYDDDVTLISTFDLPKSRLDVNVFQNEGPSEYLTGVIPGI